MRNVLVALLVLVAAVSGPARAEAPAGSPVARHGALAVKDGQIVDAQGAPVTLRGMSLFWSQWAPQYYSGETIELAGARLAGRRGPRGDRRRGQRRRAAALRP